MEGNNKNSDNAGLRCSKVREKHGNKFSALNEATGPMTWFIFC